MPRLIALWVPDWPVACLILAGRQAPGNLPHPALEAVAVLEGQHVRAASAPARAQGVERGMRAHVATSLCPTLHLIPRHLERETRTFEEVMEAASQVWAQPVVARPGLALCAAAGPTRWLGSEEAVAQALVEAVAQGPGLECQVGIADSLLAAVLAARRGVLVPPEQSTDFLHAWPLKALLYALPTVREEQECRDLITTLSRLGIHDLGHFAALPAGDVAARFGPAGARAHALARAEASWVPRSHRPLGHVAVHRRCDPPLDRADTAAFMARSLVDDLGAALLARGAQAHVLSLEAVSDDGSEFSRSWMSDPQGRSADLADRLRWQFEEWLRPRPGHESPTPLVELRLEAQELSSAQASPEALWAAPGQESTRRAWRSAARLEHLLGPGRVRMAQIIEGRDPRSRSLTVPWEQVQARTMRARDNTGERRGSGQRVPTPSSGEGREDRQRRDHGTTGEEAATWEGMLPAPWPAVLLRKPCPVELRDAQGHEVTIAGNGMMGSAPSTILLPTAAWRYGLSPTGSPTVGRVQGGEQSVVSHAFPTSRLSSVPASADSPSLSSSLFSSSSSWPSYPVAGWAGPWVMDEGWWRPEGAWRRAYLHIIASGVPPLLLVRAGRWWLEGVYQ